MFLAVIPSILFSIYVYRYYSDSIFLRVQQERKVSVMQTASNMDLKLLSIENMAHNLSYRSSLVQLLAKENIPAYPTWYKKKFEESRAAMKHTLLYQDLGINEIMLYTSNPGICEKNGFCKSSRIENMDFYEKFLNDDAVFDIHCLTEQETSDYYSATERTYYPNRQVTLSLFKILSLNNDILGILIFEFATEDLFSPIQIAVENGNQYAVLFSDGRYYGIDPHTTCETIPENMIYESLDHFDILVTDADILHKSVYTKSAKYILFILLGGIFYNLFLFSSISKSIIRRLNSDLNEMDRILQNNYKGRLKIKGNDEISAISVRYNILLDKMDALIKDMIAKERKGKTAQLKALQYQINPHFIYNTLNIFSACAENDRNYQLSDAISSFGHLLRYTLKDDGLYGTVASELENAQSLTSIYGIRRIENINLITECPEELQQCKIIKFIIQPIIENSILHGWKKGSSDMLITINVSKDDNFLIIKISDNGVGMQPEQLKKVIDHITNGTSSQETSSGHSSFIGLRNVYERIKLYYGPDASMVITSRYMLYTQIHLSIPFNNCSGE